MNTPTENQFHEGQSVLVDGKTQATVYAHPCYIPGHRELYVRVSVGNDVWEVAVSRVAVLHPDNDARTECARLEGINSELLEALKAMVAAFNQSEIDPLIAFVSIESARAAIDKATKRPYFAS